MSRKVCEVVDLEPGRCLVESGSFDDNIFVIVIQTNPPLTAKHRDALVTLVADYLFDENGGDTMTCGPLDDEEEAPRSTEPPSTEH